MKINEAVRENYNIVIDSYNFVIRVWTKLPADGRTRRAIRNFFPSMEDYGSFIKLGGYSSLSEAMAAIADAKMSSAACLRLYLESSRDIYC